MNAKHAEAKDVMGDLAKAENPSDAGGANHAKENFSPPASADATVLVGTPTAQPTRDGVRLRWWADLTPSLRALAIIASLAAFGFLVNALAPVLTPFMFGAILSYVGTPVVAWFERHRVPRAAGAVVVIVAIAAFLGGLILVVAPLVSSEIARISEKLPELLTKIQEQWLPWLNATLGTSLSFDLSQLKTLAKENAGAVGGISTKLAGSLQLGGQILLGLIVNLTLVPVVMFYLLRDWPHLVDGIDAAMPSSISATVRDLAREIDAVLSEFLRGQGMVMLALATYYCIALKVAGLEFALPVGLVTGLLVFIPYIGFGLGLMLGMLAALTQFVTPGPIIAVAAIFVVGQILEGFVLVPYLVGDRIGLHPLAVIFALMAFGQLFGFVGVLLALPASAALLVALRVLKRELAAGAETRV
jgi:predicted PurR-regulated permease PerM